MSSPFDFSQPKSLNPATHCLVCGKALGLRRPCRHCGTVCCSETCLDRHFEVCDEQPVDHSVTCGVVVFCVTGLFFTIAFLATVFYIATHHR